MMADLVIKIGLDDLLSLIDQLKPNEREILRQHLIQHEADDFRSTLANIHARMPQNVSEEEAAQDIQATLNEVREQKP